MKKILCLLLCLLMLFCIGCKKEEPKPVYGEQYISGGYVYNTHVRMRLVTEELKPPKTVVSELRAPVESITVEIQNDTDYYVNLGHFYKWHCEKWENGEWVAVPEAYIYVDTDVLQSPKMEYDWIEPQSSKTFTELIVPDDPSSMAAVKDATPLGEGVYRFRSTAYLTEKQTTGGTEIMLEVYFTVAPSLD